MEGHIIGNIRGDCIYNQGIPGFTDIMEERYNYVVENVDDKIIYKDFVTMYEPLESFFKKDVSFWKKAAQAAWSAVGVGDLINAALEAGGCKEAKTILNAVLVFRTVFSLANMADSIGNARRFTVTYQDKDWDRWAKQLAEVVIIDGRKTGLTLEQASTVIERALGKYDGELPGIVEIWTNEGILRR